MKITMKIAKIKVEWPGHFPEHVHGFEVKVQDQQEPIHLCLFDEL
jgi:hypothetical protein